MGKGSRQSKEKCRVMEFSVTLEYVTIFFTKFILAVTRHFFFSNLRDPQEVPKIKNGISTFREEINVNKRLPMYSKIHNVLSL